MKKVSILIPAYNEELSIPYLYEALHSILDKLPLYNWEILFVNDGSTDHTLELIQELQLSDSRISYLDLSRNFGKEAAMLAGFDYITGDCMIILDADLQDTPDLIPEMLRYWEEGYDDIYARRKSRGEESFIRKHLSLLFYSILQKSTKLEILPNVGDFRLLNKNCIHALRQLRERERYTKGLFCWIGFKKKEIVFDRGSRISGKSAWNLWSLSNLAIEGITSFTVAPLRISTFIGLVVSCLSFIYMMYMLIKSLIYGDPVQGFPTLIVVILFLGGIQLLSLGIIGEYLGRIFNETKQRPTYIVKSYNGKEVCPKQTQ